MQPKSFACKENISSNIRFKNELFIFQGLLLLAGYRDNIFVWDSFESKLIIIVDKLVPVIEFKNNRAITKPTPFIKNKIL